MVDGPVTNRRFSRRTVRKAVIISVSVLVFFLVARRRLEGVLKPVCQC